jgi:segregation and condensation protein B
VVGHKEVPGRPSLYATTPGFLDYFNLRSLTELPSLDELRDLEEIGRDVFSSAEITDDYTSVTQENADYALDEES